MKKYSKNDIQNIKNIPVESILRSMGFSLVERGGTIKILCPFHEEKTPSFSVNKKTNLYKCFGCDFGGDAITFVEKYMNTDFNTSVAYLLNLLGLEKSNNIKTAGKTPELEPSLFSSLAVDTSTSLSASLTKPEYQKLFMLVLGYYHNCLKESKDAISYLMRRGLKAGELLEKFQIGYCPGDLLTKLSLSDSKQITMLKEMGILNEKINERFYRCIVFPLFDDLGNIVQIYGRSITSENAFKHMLLPTVAEHGRGIAGIFNKWAFQSLELFICESVIDTLSLMQLGIVSVTSTLGVGGVTRELLDKIGSVDLKKIYICFDNDKAGNEGAIKLTEQLKEYGVDVYRIEFEKSKDANDFLRSFSGQEKVVGKSDTIALASQDFKVLVSDAKPLFQLENKESMLPLVSDHGRTIDDPKKPSENYKKVGNEYQFSFGPRRYIVRGLEKNKDNTSLKVFLKINYNNKFHIDNNLDLFTARSKASFIKYSTIDLELEDNTVKDDLAKIVSTLDGILQKELDKREESKSKKKEFQIDIGIQQQAIGLSKESRLAVIFLEAVNRCGVVGENLNIFILNLVTLSRFLSNPLHSMLQSEFAAGKSTILNFITSLVPEEDLLYFTQLTPQSLYYIEDDGLKNKVLAIAEIDGLSNIIYPLKQLMSENFLSNLSTGTDPETGEHKSNSNRKEGPTPVIFTSPKEGNDEEVENRCIIQTLNESQAQTKNIQNMQRLKHSIEGRKMVEEKKKVSSLYQHLQREIKIKEVYNPYASYLSFTSLNHRTRRHNEKYLILMDCITLFFFNQREVIVKYGRKMLKTHLIDIALTNFLTRRIFGRILDELPPQTRNFLDKVEREIKKRAKENHTSLFDVYLYRREIRDLTGLSNTRVHEHCSRLKSYDYFDFKRDKNGIAYRIIYSANEYQSRSLLELRELESLKKRASQKEKEEYSDFTPNLKELFKLLDETYEEGEL